MGDDAEVERFIAHWRDTGGSELANTQSFINGLCRLIGVEPPRGSRTDDAQNDYVFERRVFQDNGDGTVSFGRIDCYNDYNTERPHSSLGYATPAAFAAELEQQRAELTPPVASPALLRNNTGRSLIAAG